LAPFHCTTRFDVTAPSVDEPTAVHEVTVAHEIPTRLSKSSGLVPGLATIDHADPFQDSTRVCHTACTTTWPTAVQVPVVGHDTELRTSASVTDGSGLTTTDQADPFHVSTRVWLTVPVK
jgi:hypothetical protein